MAPVKAKPSVSQMGKFIKDFFNRVHVNVKTTFKTDNDTETKSILDNILPEMTQSLTFDFVDISFLRDVILIICAPLLTLSVICHLLCKCGSPKQKFLPPTVQTTMKSIGTQTESYTMMQKRNSV